jgi:uncharacterized protein
MIRWWMICLALLGLALPSMAEPLDINARLAAATALRDGDYATALKIYRPLAEQGDPVAIFSLATMYHRGGRGVPKDIDEALRWYTKAGDQGDTQVQMLLATMYYMGSDLPQDFSKAATWYGKAADRGVSEAQSMLGLMYAEGEGVPQDYVLAHKWSNLAASAAAPGKDRAEAINQRDRIAARMTPQQIAESQRLAREWKPK